MSPELREVSGLKMEMAGQWVMSPKKSGKASSSGGRVSLQMGRQRKRRQVGWPAWSTPSRAAQNWVYSGGLNHSWQENDKPHC